MFTAHPIESLRGIKGEYKVVHLIRHAQGEYQIWCESGG